MVICNSYKKAGLLEDSPPPVEEISEEDSTLSLFNHTLEEINTNLSAFPDGLSQGIQRMIVQSAALGGVIDQEVADGFAERLDRQAEEKYKDHTTARFMNLGGDIAGQYVLPVIGVRKVLLSTFPKVKPLFATALSELAVGFSGISPNEDTIIEAFMSEETPERNEVLEDIRVLLSTNPEQSNLVNRSKHAVETLVTMGLTEGVARGFVKSLHYTRNFLNSSLGKSVGQAFVASGATVAASQESKAEELEETNFSTNMGRPVFTKGSDAVSELSTTFKYKGNWINIPSVHNGKEYATPELIQMLDNKEIEPTSTHDNKKEAINAAKERSENITIN